MRVSFNFNIYSKNPKIALKILGRKLSLTLSTKNTPLRVLENLKRVLKRSKSTISSFIYIYDPKLSKNDSSAMLLVMTAEESKSSLI